MKNVKLVENWKEIADEVYLDRSHGGRHCGDGDELEHRLGGKTEFVSTMEEDLDGDVILETGMMDVYIYKDCLEEA